MLDNQDKKFEIRKAQPANIKPQDTIDLLELFYVLKKKIKPGGVITMSAGCRHTVLADTELKLIEVQLGEDINVYDKQKFELQQLRTWDSPGGRKMGV